MVARRPKTYYSVITERDIGRQVALIRGIDYEWSDAPPGTVVTDVNYVYVGARTVATIASPEWGPFNYSACELRLEPLR